MLLAGIAIAVFSGLAMAVQARINGDLGAELHNGVLAAVINFGVGLVLVLVVVVIMPSGRRAVVRLRTAGTAGTLRWWQCVGGLSGALVVTGQGLTAATLGVAVFTVALAAGQVVSSLAVDHVGLGPSGPVPVTMSRIGGAIAAVVAVVFETLGEQGHGGHLWLAALPVVGGATLAWQQAVNGRVRQAAGSASVTALLNFSTGFTALVMVAVLDLVIGSIPRHLTGPWWTYLGGVMGAAAVASAAVAVRMTGVLVLGLCSIAGQVGGALLLDTAWPALNHPVRPDTLIGALLTVAAVSVAVPCRRRPRSAVDLNAQPEAGSRRN